MWLSSLKVRFLLVAALVLALFSISAGLILRESFQASIRDRAQEQLKLQLYGLLSSTDFEEDGLHIPTALSEPRFNQLQSGLFAAIYSSTKRIWQSQSFFLEKDYTHQDRVAGEWFFADFQDLDGKKYYSLSLTVLWEVEAVEQPFTFVIWESDQPYLAQIKSFEKTLWAWLGGLIIASICIIFVGLQLGFKPFQRLAKELQDVEQAKQHKIKGQYPKEINPVVGNLNRLIEHERSMRERYKNSLGDLAHSLKTPLAVLKGIHDQQSLSAQAGLVQQQIGRMDDIVNYQLKRAISSVPNLSSQGALLLDLYQKMQSVLHKVYFEKQVEFSQDIRAGLRVPWDEGDALEVLGNLMDNACKYGAGQVRVCGWIEAGQICITVEDNGSGILDADKEFVLQRGGRRDELASGQGIGLSVVMDIVAASGGELDIDQSELGGAKFFVQLPLF